MTTLEANYVKSIVQSTIESNFEEIQEYLLSGIDDSTTTEEIVPRMAIRSIAISSNIAVQLILDILTQAGILEIDQELLKKTSLKVVN